MLKRIAVMTMAGAAAVGLAATSAGAQQYPPQDNLLTVSDTTPCPGGAVTINAQVFIPGSTVTISLDEQTIGTPTADENGRVTLEATIPETTELGEHIITALGQGIEEADLHLTATIEVVPCEAPPTTAAPGAAGDLPTAGSNSTMTMVRIGLGLAAAGGIALALAHRRRRRHAAPAH